MKLAAISGVNGVFSDEAIAEVVKKARKARLTWTGTVPPAKKAPAKAAAKPAPAKKAVAKKVAVKKAVAKTAAPRKAAAKKTSKAR